VAPWRNPREVARFKFGSFGFEAGLQSVQCLVYRPRMSKLGRGNEEDAVFLLLEDFPQLNLLFVDIAAAKAPSQSPSSFFLKSNPWAASLAGLFLDVPVFEFFGGAVAEDVHRVCALDGANPLVWGSAARGGAVASGARLLEGANAPISGHRKARCRFWVRECGGEAAACCGDDGCASDVCGSGRLVWLLCFLSKLGICCGGGR